MRKNLYSLILFDEVIEAVDRLAYSKNTNRSALINDILAQHVGMLTPEQRTNRIIESMITKVNQEATLQMRIQNQNGNLQFGTFLKYKYKPSIKYTFEFFSRDHKRYAILKVVSRTQSPELCSYLSNFFQLLAQVDRKRFGELHALEVSNCIPDECNNRFSREFLSGISMDGIDEEDVAEYLTCYLRMLDEALRFYIANINELSDMMVHIDNIYMKHLGELQIYRHK